LKYRLDERFADTIGADLRTDKDGVCTCLFWDENQKPIQPSEFEDGNRVIVVLRIEKMSYNAKLEISPRLSWRIIWRQSKERTPKYTSRTSLPPHAKKRKKELIQKTKNKPLAAAAAAASSASPAGEHPTTDSITKHIQDSIAPLVAIAPVTTNGSVNASMMGTRDSSGNLGSNGAAENDYQKVLADRKKKEKANKAASRKKDSSDDDDDDDDDGSDEDSSKKKQKKKKK
jgi:hypothetical protein